MDLETLKLKKSVIFPHSLVINTLKQNDFWQSGKVQVFFIIIRPREEKNMQITSFYKLFSLALQQLKLIAIESNSLQFV